VLTAIDAAHTFDAYSPSATIGIANPGSRPILSALELKKLFPIQPGQFGASPDLTNCGAYCEYSFEIYTKVQDISAANHYNDYHQQVSFYVRNDLNNYFQMWHDKLVCNFPCLSASSGISGHIS
jgi:hypothetical protein